MSWVWNLMFSGSVYQLTKSYTQSLQLPWLNLVAPLIAATLCFYFQWIWQISIKNFKSLLWISFKILLIQSIISLPVVQWDMYSWLKTAWSLFSWGLSILIVMAPEESKLSPLFYINAWLVKLGLKFKKNIEIKNIEEVDLLGNNGKDFESYIRDVYKELGFDAWTTTELREKKDLPKTVLLRGGSGEQGVDVVVYFPTPRVIGQDQYEGLLVQCKQYSSTVGNKAIQEIFSAIPMYSQHFQKKFKPVVVTNNYFTKQAQDLAKSNGVNLMDRELLASLLNKINQNKAKLAA